MGHHIKASSVTNRGIETRNKLLNIAERLVLRNGYSAASLEDILNLAGVTKVSFYHHFINKADLGIKILKKYAKNDINMSRSWLSDSQKIHKDSRTILFEFLKKFEYYLINLLSIHEWRIFASFIYEIDQFDEDVSNLIRISLGE